MLDKSNPPTSFGVFKPVGHTLIAFYTADELQAAQEKLSGLGFASSSMVHYGRFMIEDLTEKSPGRMKDRDAHPV